MAGVLEALLFVEQSGGYNARERPPGGHQAYLLRLPGPPPSPPPPPPPRGNPTIHVGRQGEGCLETVVVKTTLEIPERIDGWQGLSDWLATLDLQQGAAALCERARRKDLPYHGGGLPGVGVYFGSEDLQAWVADLTNVDLDLWIIQTERNRTQRASRAAGPEPSVPRRPGPWKHFVAQREHFVLLKRVPFGETVLRARSGECFVATTREEIDAWPQHIVEAADAVVLFQGFRIAREPDFLHQAAAAGRVPYLLAAFRMWESRLRPIEVPGKVLGWGDIEGEAPVVISPYDPRLPEVRRVVEKLCPAANWVAWQDRVELDPVTLDVISAKDGAGRRSS